MDELQWDADRQWDDCPKADAQNVSYGGKADLWLTAERLLLAPIMPRLV